MEFLFELLFELFGEVLLQVLGELLAEWGVHLTRPAERRRPPHPLLTLLGYALLGLHLNYRPAQRWELYARINNVTNRRYETFGAVAPDMFPNGRLLQPLDGAVQAAPVRFVAPGAPRSVVAGLRYHF